MDVHPLSIILVKSDSKGDRLLFRYPFAAPLRNESNKSNRRRNPYALTITEDLLQSPPSQTSNISNGQLTGFSDEVLSTLFAVKPELCEQKFELKVNDVRFVGHPTLIHSGATYRSGSGGSSTGKSKPDNPGILINIQFALQATASHSIVKCYYDLSKHIGIALRHEEKRCEYLTQETKTMVAAHDEIAAHGDHTESPFDLILKRSALARDLKIVYDDLCSTGEVHMKINKWVEVSFCLPQKAHQFHNKDFLIEPEMINKCLQSLRPYHGLLLLVEAPEFLAGLSPDASPALTRLIRVYSPLRSLQCLAADADIELTQVFKLAGHLVYWAKATVIYPLCESNIYVVSPDAPTYMGHPLVEKFSEQFQGHHLLQVLSEFSMPSTLSQRVNPLQHPQQHSQLVRMLIWMLQHRLLLQLHTYVYFMAMSPSGPTAQAAPARSSHRSTPDDLDPSESDLSSNISDDITHSPILRPTNTATDIVGFDEKAQLLSDLTDEERTSVLKVPAASNPDDLALFARLHHHFREMC
ncbi:hypothetical protein B566_EDAN010707 [Ephemera danica]|nr:hypothetical protein B566_EDAN010707 [Ephemera danica]